MIDKIKEYLEERGISCQEFICEQPELLVDIYLIKILTLTYSIELECYYNEINEIKGRLHCISDIDDFNKTINDLVRISKGY